MRGMTRRCCGRAGAGAGWGVWVWFGWILPGWAAGRPRLGLALLVLMERDLGLGTLGLVRWMGL